LSGGRRLVCVLVFSAHLGASFVSILQGKYSVYAPHTAGRYARKRFRKAQVLMISRVFEPSFVLAPLLMVSSCARRCPSYRAGLLVATLRVALSPNSRKVLFARNDFAKLFLGSDHPFSDVVCSAAAAAAPTSRWALRAYLCCLLLFCFL